MLAALDTVLGRICVGLVLVVATGVTAYLVGHNKGFDAATAHYTAVVQACMDANQQDQQTIDQLRSANQSFAAAASAQADRADKAQADLATAQKASSAALVKYDAALSGAIHDDNDAATWGAAVVPVGVVDVLRDAAGQDANGDGH